MSNAGIVKSVTSDSIVVTRGSAERTIRLEGVNSPRLGNREKVDDLGAFEARELMRRTVGKEVKFTVTSSAGSIEYGSVLFEGEDLALELVRAGLATVKEGKGEPDERKLQLLSAQEEAVKKPLETREVNYTMPEDGVEYFTSNKGKEIDAIVESVINGSTLRVRLMTPGQHQIAQLAIAGIRAPRSANAEGLRAEPFGDEARSFLEARLLLRKIKVILLSLPSPNQAPVAFGSTADTTTPVISLFIGLVLHPSGRNIAALILSSGLAKFVDWHVGFLSQAKPEELKELRAAESSAKASRLRVWKDLPSPSTSNSVGASSPNRNFNAIVTRVWGADMLSIQEAGKPERRIQLSSVRQPKIDSNLVGYQMEGKELLRKKLIGKSVAVSIDYIKAAEGAYEARECGTINVAGGLNVSCILVEKGLLGVIRHRQDDEKSTNYDDLLVAEAKAIAESKGIHSGKPSLAKKIIDASESASKANSFLSSYKRAGKLSGVVDFVSAGSRFKLLLPKESTKLVLVLEGIRCPRTSEPFGSEAQAFANLRVLQRDVEISTGGCDKAGAFIGKLMIGGKDLAVLLVEQGLAKVDDYSNSKELYAAQEIAQASQLGIWKSYDAAEEALANGSLYDLISAKKEFVDVIVSDIRGDREDIPFSFAVQVLKNGNSIPELEKLMEQINGTTHEFPVGFKPKSNDLVLAKFSQDGQCYRARVRRSNPAKSEAEVLYIDFGNSEILPFSRLGGILPPALSKLEPQAKEATLSFVNLLPFFTEYGPASLELFKDMCEGRQLVANIDRRESNLLNLTLFDPKLSTKSINELLILEGLARIDNKSRLLDEDMMKKLKIATEEAKKSRAGAYELGDIFDD